MLVEPCRQNDVNSLGENFRLNRTNPPTPCNFFVYATISPKFWFCLAEHTSNAERMALKLEIRLGQISGKMLS